MRMLFFVIVVLQVVLSCSAAFAHPASGIVVDQFGNVYFIYSGVGVAKISVDGRLSYIHSATDGHWMCLDEKGIFSKAKPKYFERITPDGVKPVIIFAGGGSPIIVNGDGNFYYCGGPNGDLHPGALTLVQETPKNKQIVFASNLQKTLDGFDDGITGLAAAPDGSIYAACWNSILKITPNGEVQTIAHPVIINDCDEDPADHKDINRGKPLLRGIAVDSSGAVYAAAVSCHCLIKITPGGEIHTILKSERPWSPTGVATRKGIVYVLEYTNANGPATEGWYPRILQIGKDGRVTIMADLSVPK